jgi:hypothetical protein
MRARHNKHQPLISHAAAYREKRPRLEPKGPSGALRIVVVVPALTSHSHRRCRRTNNLTAMYAMMSQQQNVYERFDLIL